MTTTIIASQIICLVYQIIRFSDELVAPLVVSSSHHATGHSAPSHRLGFLIRDIRDRCSDGQIVRRNGERIHECHFGNFQRIDDAGFFKIGHLIRGENIHLVNGGHQQRCFTYISDGIEALLRIIANHQDCAQRGIFNIGNPDALISIRNLAKTLKTLILQYYPAYTAHITASQFMDTSEEAYYGAGYQDVTRRLPSIHRATTQLHFTPTIDLPTGLKNTLDFYLTANALHSAPT